jgi:pimeloyl-ACP methyl ester carboxylesterase
VNLNGRIWSKFRPAEDETRPVHSRRVFEALAGAKRLVIVDGAGHGDALARAWGEVEAWMKEAVPR